MLPVNYACTTVSLSFIMFLEIAVAEVIDGCSCASGIARPWKRKEGMGAGEGV